MLTALQQARQAWSSRYRCHTLFAFHPPQVSVVEFLEDEKSRVGWRKGFLHSVNHGHNGENGRFLLGIVYAIHRDDSNPGFVIERKNDFWYQCWLLVYLIRMVL